MSSETDWSRVQSGMQEIKVTNWVMIQYLFSGTNPILTCGRVSVQETEECFRCIPIKSSLLHKTRDLNERNAI